MWRSCHREVAQGSGRSNQLHFQEGNSAGLSCFRCLFRYPRKLYMKSLRLENCLPPLQTLISLCHYISFLDTCTFFNAVTTIAGEYGSNEKLPNSSTAFLTYSGTVTKVTFAEIIRINLFLFVSNIKIPCLRLVQ